MSVVNAKQRARMPTILAVKRFLRYSERFADSTQKQYRGVLWRFFDDMPEFVELITPENIDRFIHSLKVSNNSKNSILIPIRSFFRYLSDFYDIKNIAAKVKDFRKQPPRQRVISEEELDKILKVASENPIEHAIISFLSNTGLRASEFCSLVPISPDQSYISVIGKGNRRRIVPLNATAKSCIPAIFGKYNRDSLSWIMKKLCRKAGIPLAGPHSLRHYFVTKMIRKGVSRSVVAKIAGMSETVLEKTYLHLIDSDLLGVTDVLDL